MPYRRKNSTNWWISYADADGTRVRESAGTANRREATTLEATRRAEIHRVSKWNEPAAHSFDEVMLAYLKETESKKSHSRDLTSAKRLYEHFRGVSIQSIGAPEVTAYKSARTQDGVAVATIGKELWLLSAAIRHMNAAYDWNLPNPVSGRVPQPKKKEMRWFTRDEAAALMRASSEGRAGDHMGDFVRLGLSTGMRTGEMLKLQWRRVDIARAMVRFDSGDQKKGVPGSIPLNQSAVAVLVSRLTYRNRHHPGSPWVFPSPKVEGQPILSVKVGFRYAVRRAGIPYASPHALRHTFASWLVQAGVPLREVCELCRHEDIRTTMRYAHLAPHTTAARLTVIDDVLSHSGHTPENVAEVAL